MPRRSIRLSVPAEDLCATFEQIRDEIGIRGEFPPEVLAEAEHAAREPRLPDADLTDLAFVTLDPAGSMDLDQAFHLERRTGEGFRLRYAIADVAAWVMPGGAVDAEAHRRAETAYSPDGRSPLYPPVLSEAAASLLPDGPRPAVVWRIDVDADGSAIDAEVSRAVVASRTKLDYAQVQASLDAGSADPMVALLPDIGRLLQEAERSRGGASLGVPAQEVVEKADDYELAFIDQLPVEGWNAQLSLLTGRVAAAMMMACGVGILRTMPPPDPEDVARLRRIAAGLGVRWPPERSYGEVLATVDPRRSDGEAAFLQEAAALFRAASYAAFEGEHPSQLTHAAIAAPYAHCTAPLRRLVDRYASEICLACTSGAEVPAWVRETLPTLPAVMAEGAERGNRLERAVVDAVEAAVLAPHVGQEFEAVVVDLWKRHRGEVVLRRPAVIGPCEGVTELGAAVRVKLIEADLGKRTIGFTTSSVP